ncbi:MAG: polysaccharide biosynthesis protein [Reyranella sp.]|nr:polysaccharide biosynthesis protein [Reyranella sp.]
MGRFGNIRRKQMVAFVHDVAMAVIAVFVAVVFRFGTFDYLEERGLFSGAILPFTAAAAISLILLRNYRTSWRHVSTADLVTIVQTATLAVLIYLPLSFVTTRLSEIPRTFVVIAWVLFIVLMSGSRVAYRLFHERGLLFMRRSMQPGQVPVLLVGGGNNAEIFLRSLDDKSEFYAVGVLDDLASGNLLRGVPVLGRIDEAEKVIESFGDDDNRPRKLVVVERTLPTEVLEQLVALVARLGLTIARIPDLSQLRPGTEDKPELQPISVEDLLGRPQIVLDPAPVMGLIAGKRVLITGAGGSIGSEIVRQVCSIGPAALCLVDSSELNLYTIDGEVARDWPQFERVARVIDVRHRPGIGACMTGFKPDIVFHAAALKHVPIVEANPAEGIWTNAIGSRNVADAAVATGCRTMVLISTDKAVNPTNVMGASKRCAESYVQALALAQSVRPNATRFVAVRFGNVLGSTGSVVPLFERQLKAGGPLTVTHADIERFFMTIREAVQLVLQASALGTQDVSAQGKVFVLDMGQPVKIVDLARQMIRLAGLRPEIDVAVQFTGLRPGEKLYEELFHYGEQIAATAIPRVNVASPRTAGLRQLTETLSRLQLVCEAGNAAEAIAIVKSLVPEFRHAGAAPQPVAVLEPVTI